MNKKILLIGLIITVITMSIGYALYSTSLKVKGIGSIDSNFNIEVTNINEDKKEGKAVSITNPTYTKTSASFNTKLSREKDSIEYKVEITNKGSIDGKIENIEVTNPNELIKVEIRGIDKGQIIKAGEALEYIVRVYIPEGTKVNQDVTSKIEVNTEIIQDDNQIFNEPHDGINQDKLSIESTIEESNYTTITSTVNAKGNGLKYSYSLDGETYTEPSENNTHTFNNLTPNKRYTVYYKVEDKDGNYVTESKWIETKHDNNAPECTLEVKEITLDNIKIKATCSDETEIVKYELSNNGGLFEDKGLEIEYSIDPFSPSLLKIKVTDIASNNKEYKLNDNQLNEIYQRIYTLLNDEYKEVLNDKNSYKDELLNKTYPIGSIYIASNNENPSETIGGTWEAYGTGKTMVGVDSNDNNFNTVNKVGGTSTTTLATTNMPSHTHSIPALTGTAASAGDHTHTRGTMNITGQFIARDFNNDKNNLIHYASGAFSVSYVKTTDSTTMAVASVTKTPWYNNILSFDASKDWTGSTSSNGAHTHSVTTTASTSGSIGSGSAFSNLQPYITVYIWKRIN